MKMKMRVFLKGGAQFTVEVTEFAINRDFTGSLAGLDWKWRPEAASVLKYLDLSEVAAILREDEDEDGDGDEPVQVDAPRLAVVDGQAQRDAA